jgi:cytochrome c2
MGDIGSADTWTLNGDASHVAFGSIKKDTIGEVHRFDGLSGTVSAGGDVAVEINLASVETLIDIRNERMQEFVFQSAPKAMINASIDMSDVSGLAAGESAVVDATGTIQLAGNTLELDAEMFVVRISDSQVMVTTNDMIMLSIEDMGLTAGIDKLMELANLPGITRVSPVTLRFIFDLDTQKAEAAPAAPAADGLSTVAAVSGGDADEGKKAFRKCKACHQIKEGKNGVGPNLYQVVGRRAGQADGFAYSDVLSAADLLWTPENIAAFLADPKGYLPGNKMSFRGLRKEDEIANLIAYLASEG